MSTKKQIPQTLLEVICAECDEIHPNYSGRGMSGETCFGIPGFIYADIAKILEVIYDQPEAVKTLSYLLADARLASFGIGQIIYFPGWASPETKEA